MKSLFSWDVKQLQKEQQQKKFELDKLCALVYTIEVVRIM